MAADVAGLAAILHGLGARARDPKTARRYRREAETLYKRAIETFARTLGKGHFEVGFNLGQLAALLHTAGRHAEASRLYARAIAIQIRVLGTRHPQLALTLANVAELRRGARTGEQRKPRAPTPER